MQCPHTPGVRWQKCPACRADRREYARLDRELAKPAAPPAARLSARERPESQGARSERLDREALKLRSR